MDMKETIVPKSDQLNADDLISGPMTVTVSKVTKGTTEQPVDVHLVETPGRAYRPSKSMRRVMVAGWGTEATAYTGHTLTLFCNPDIMFGKDKVGGIQISHMSHLTKPLTVALTATRGKRKSFTVEPLNAEPVKDTSGRDWMKELTLAGDNLAALTALGEAASHAHAGDMILGMIRTEYTRVKAGQS